MRYYGQQRWHSAPCPEGFSPGTPVSLTPEKPKFPNSNLTKLATHCRGLIEMKNYLTTQGENL